MHETIVSNRLSPPLPLPRISKRKRIRGKSSRVPFFGDNRTGGYPFTLPPPFSVFTFNFTEPNVTRGLSVGSRSETNSIAPCDSRGRETRGGGPPPPIEYGRYVNVVRKERGIKMNRLPEIYLHGEKVTAFIQYPTPSSCPAREEFKPSAVGRRTRDREIFFPPYFVIFLFVRTKRTFLR